mmetsp:Transcript_96582/g.171721  ORF Transcript_96582/g.171721 Transcript_96582/m.171721 type:complete len:591 (-) Transcript_96582:40-1812(-)
MSEDDRHKSLKDRRSKKPRKLDPREIQRSVVLIQAAFRRWSLEDPRRLLGIGPTMPSPPLAVALVFKRRLVHPESIDVEGEAMASASIICGRNTNLTLGPLVACYSEYWGKLPADEGIFEFLKERFEEVATEMDEKVLRQCMMQQARLPSQVRALMAEAGEIWGAPEPSDPIVGYHELWKACEVRILELKKECESTFTARLEFATTRRSIKQLADEVDKELGDGHTALRGRLIRARIAHKDRLELEVQSNFGWPPKGQAATLCHAMRWFAVELGEGSLAVQDFLKATLRELRAAEKAADEMLAPVESAAGELRRRLGLWPEPPKLIKQALLEELKEIVDKAKETLVETVEDLGYESPKVLKRFSSILQEDFFAHCQEAISSASEVLRTCSATKADEEEIVLQNSARLFQLLEVMQAEGGPNGVAVATELGTEFEHELEEVKYFMRSTRPDLMLVEEEPDDGWHAPPEFRELDQPLGTPEPPYQPRVLTPEPPPPPPEPQPDISVCMKLHSVAVEDTKARSEIVLMEKCAMIIAEECGIPRQWITHFAFQEATLPVAPPAIGTIEEGDDAMSDISRRRSVTSALEDSPTKS